MSREPTGDKTANTSKILRLSCIGCTVIPSLLIISGLFFIRTYVNRVGDKLPAELAKLRALGIPVDPVDLNPKPPVADAENAAHIYKSIGYQFEALKDDKNSSALRVALGRYSGPRANPADLPLVLQAMTKFAPIFSDAEKLLSKPRVDYKRDYSKGFNLLFPEYSEHRQLTKWMVSRANAQMQSSNLDGALKSIHVAFQIGQHDADEPTLIGALVCIAEHAIAYRQLEAYLTQVRDNPVQLGKVKSMLASVQPLPDLRRCFAGEFVLGRESLKSINKGSDLAAMAGDSSLERDLGRIPLGNPGVKRMFEANHCEAWRRVFERMPEDGRDWRAINEAMVSEGKRIESDKSIDNMINRILFPVFDQACQAFGRQQAERKLAILATQLLIDRSKGLPNDLRRYGKLAIDPLSGKSFGYRVKGKGFLLWSVGRDLQDNGGVVRSPGSQSTAGNSYDGVDMVIAFDATIPTVP